MRCLTLMPKYVKLKMSSCLHKQVKTTDNRCIVIMITILILRTAAFVKNGFVIEQVVLKHEKKMFYIRIYMHFYLCLSRE